MNEETHYRLLRLLEDQPGVSQRQIAAELGVSLGKVNYCVKALVDRGWVKAGNFYRSSRKRNYLYQLTPRGIAAKGHLAVRFLRRKEAEYEALVEEIESLRDEIREYRGS